MELLSLDGLRIGGIAACLPKNAVRNEAKVAEATGIVTRRIAAGGTTVVDLCVKAAERVMSDTGAKSEEFGALLFVSFTQPNRMPAAACEAQARLGFPKGIIAFDVSLACSGWGYGLYLAGLLARETGKKVLLLDGDVQSTKVGRGEGEKVRRGEGERVREGDVSSLLGDAGTATIVELNKECGTKNEELWKFSFVADGEKGDALKLEDGGTIRMDGFGVFKFVAIDVVAYIKNFLTHLPTLSPSHPLTFVPHQPNAYMVRQLAKSVGIDEARTAISCDALGNLSSASVPATIAWKGVRGPVLFAGFGGGLSVSVGLVGLDDGCKLSVLEV